jgi:condensin complex subunit 2
MLAFRLSFITISCSEIKAYFTLILVQEFNEYTVEIPQGPVVDGRLEKIADLLLLGMGSSKTNAWAGPEHWKYRKAKGIVCHLISLGFNHAKVRSFLN